METTLYIRSKAKAKAMSFIRAAEPLRLTAYCCHGVWKIGYGHPISKADLQRWQGNINGAAMPGRGLASAADQLAVKEMIITRPVADIYLQTDFLSAAAVVGEMSRDTCLNTNQQAALIVLALDIGASQLACSALVKAIVLRRPLAEVEREFLRWRFQPDGHIDYSMLYRREAEFKLYCCNRDL